MSACMRSRRAHTGEAYGWFVLFGKAVRVERERFAGSGTAARPLP